MAWEVDVSFFLPPLTLWYLNLSSQEKPRRSKTLCSALTSQASGHSPHSTVPTPGGEPESPPPPRGLDPGMPAEASRRTLLSEMEARKSRPGPFHSSLRICRISLRTLGHSVYSPASVAEGQLRFPCTQAWISCIQVNSKPTRSP